MAKSSKTKAPGKVAKAETPQDLENVVADLTVKYGKVALIALGVIFAISIFMAMSGNEDVVDPKEAAAQANLDESLGLLKNDMSAIYGQPPSDEDLKKKVMDYSAVVTNHKGTKAAADAKYFRAMTYFQSGKYEEAANSFTKYYEENPDRFPLTALARLGAAKSLMSTGKAADVEKALNVLTLGRDSVGPADLKNRFTYQLAICYILLGKKEDAVKTLTPLADAKKAGNQPGPYRSQEASVLLPLVKANDGKTLSEFLTGYPKALVKETPEAEKKAAPKKAGS